MRFYFALFDVSAVLCFCCFLLSAFIFHFCGTFFFGFSAIKRAVQPRCAIQTCRARRATQPYFAVQTRCAVQTRHATQPRRAAQTYVCFCRGLFVSVFAFKSELCIQNTLSQAQALRSDLQKLIIGKELYARLKAELYRRHQL